MELFASPFAGVFWIIHLVIFIWALLQILGSSMSFIQKLVWILVVWLLPLVGLIIYLLVGRKA